MKILEHDGEYYANVMGDYIPCKPVDDEKENFELCPEEPVSEQVCKALNAKSMH